MLGDIAIAGAVAVGALALLDILLGDANKRTLSDKVLRWWFWLSEAKRYSLLDALQRYHRLMIGLAILLTAAFSVWILANSNQFEAFSSASIPILVLLLVTLAMAGIFAVRRISWVLRASTLARALLRAVVFVLFALAPLYVFGLSIWLLGLDTEDQIHPNPSFGELVMYLSFLVVYFFTTFWVAAALLCASVVVFPIVLLYAATVSLLVLEVVARRVAEYPKGPILAVSALIALAAGLVKVFL